MALSQLQRAALERAISPDRLGTYRAESTRSGRDVLTLYVWDRNVAAAVMADIAILEVAMRNAMNERLVHRAGLAEWYTKDIGLDNRSLAAVARAWKDLPPSRRTAGRVVAQLTFGFWRALLEAGGNIGDGPLQKQADYEAIWRQDMHKAFPGGRNVANNLAVQYTRSWTLGVVKEIHAFRNRAAHHEPILSGIPIPGENRRITARQGLQACLTLGKLLDRDLADWFAVNSQLATALSSEP